MRLFEAIIDANHRAVAGDANAGLHPAEFAESLPVIALTCIDPRLNAFFPNALALPAEQFIWLRNAGNIITGTMSSTMRSLALACAVKGGREIAIIGHTDCQVAKTPVAKLLDELRTLGVERSRLPDNLSEFFGTFGSERQNIIKACDFAWQSPLIGPKIPVHGLLIDVETGKLDWVVNGYETLAAPPPIRPRPNFPGH
jgi:carbonic anhydrase